MIRSDKKFKKLELILNDKSTGKVPAAIKSLREEQPFEGAISLLVSYYDNSDNSSVKKLIEEFLNDIKDQSSRAEVVAEIKRELKEETLRMLISSCWQSGLDYSDHISTFTEIFILADYITAIECFTLIESSLPRMSVTKKNEIIKMIKENSASFSEEKGALAIELVLILSQA